MLISYKNNKEMKVELELMKSKLEYPESNRDMQDAVSKYVEVDFETK